MIHFLEDGPLKLWIMDRAEDGIEGGSASRLGMRWDDFFPPPGGLLDKYACWDLPPGWGKAREALGRIAASSCYAAFAWLDSRPLAMAWINPIGQASGDLHFFTSLREPQAVARAGRLFLDAAERRFPSLLCLAPRPLLGAHKLARALGFEKLAILRGACHMRSRGKVYDGILYLRRRGS